MTLSGFSSPINLNNVIFALISNIFFNLLNNLRISITL